jgi:hypothetical protein
MGTKKLAEAWTATHWVCPKCEHSNMEWGQMCNERRKCEKCKVSVYVRRSLQT